MSEEEIRTIKTASCPSLSGKSELTYEIGVKVDKSIHIRLTENSGAGMYSKAWISLAECQSALKFVPRKKIEPVMIINVPDGSHTLTGCNIIPCFNLGVFLQGKSFG